MLRRVLVTVLWAAGITAGGGIVLGCMAGLIFAVLIVSIALFGDIATFDLIGHPIAEAVVLVVNGSLIVLPLVAVVLGIMGKLPGTRATARSHAAA